MKFKLFYIILFGSYMLVSGLGHAEETEKRDIYTLTHSGYVYTFEKILNMRKGLDWPVGRITKNPVKPDFRWPDEPRFSLIRKDMMPGCGDFPPISVITIKNTSKNKSARWKKKDFILFCGNNGRGQTMRIYDPFIGMGPSLYLDEAPVDLSLDEDGIYSVRVFYRKSLRSLPAIRGMWIGYPIYYRLIPMGHTITIERGTNKHANDFYKNWVKERLFSFYKNTPFSVIAAASASGDVELYCEAKETLLRYKDKTGIDDVLPVIEEARQMGGMSGNVECKESE